MDDKSPKISFIPKGSLVREESFLERPRPRSALGILAILVFATSAAGFAGLYFYNNFLESQISTKLDQIQKIESVFSSSQQVDKANNFRFRAEIVRQLLNTHIAVNPIFKFLSENTLGSVMYTRFSFARNGNTAIVKLAGEAPTYAALAYQKEVLKQKTNELSSFAVNDVALTTFGTVTFTLSLGFSPDYLSYAKNINNASPSALSTTTPDSFLTSLRQQGIVPPPPPIFIPPVPPTPPSSPIKPPPIIPLPPGIKVQLPPTIPLPPVGTTTAGIPIGSVGSTTDQIATTSVANTNQNTRVAPPSPAIGTTPVTHSLWQSFWSWFKFW